MHDFLNSSSSIVSVVVAMDARAFRSCIARAFCFFFFVRRRDRWTDDDDDDDGGLFRFLARADFKTPRPNADVAGADGKR